jgi:hypothetical protein
VFHLACTEDLRPSLDDLHVAALDYRAEHRLNKSQWQIEQRSMVAGLEIEARAKVTVLTRLY